MITFNALNERKQQAFEARQRSIYLVGSSHILYDFEYGETNNPNHREPGNNPTPQLGTRRI
ncbi:MAG: hypothetical protein GY820_28410 [Gammaproteobacteria bacterium]|nr:hypothetical protein [Gammaproteobacteria bacterium]